MICSLCNLEKKPKSNTHYLTDSIIRTALNEDGVNGRDKGLYVNISPDNLFTDMKFQRATSTSKLGEIYRRQTTEKENQESIDNIDFSVNDKFCKECEDVFGVIEDSFNNNVLKYFRNQNFTDGQDLIKFDINESKYVRLFFLMQFWRTSICDDSFSISDDMSEQLRLKILNIEYDGLECFPLCVTYLQTLPDEDDVDSDGYKTSNYVSVVSGNNPYIIVMNDFVIQLYDDYSLPYYDFFGLNDKKSYLQFLNFNEPEFMSPVFLNQERKQFIYNMILPTVLKKIDEFRIFLDYNLKINLTNNLMNLLKLSI